jgi:hypothetical protein
VITRFLEYDLASDETIAISDNEELAKEVIITLKRDNPKRYDYDISEFILNKIKEI